MPIRISLMILTLLMGSAAMAGPTQKTRVTVEGHDYVVLVKDGTVRVVAKTFLSIFTIPERDRQRAAVEKATGCRVVDEIINGSSRVEGKLDCSSAGATPAKL